MSAPAFRGRRDNGLASEAFSPLADVDPRLGDHLLDVLGLQEIPAYVEPAPMGSPVAAERLYVASALTAQARDVLAELANELGIEVARSSHRPPRVAREPVRDLLSGIDPDAEFAAIIAEMPDLARPLADSPGAAYYAAEVDTRSPARPAVHDDVVEHYVPPPAPPLPRLTAATVAALLVLLTGIAMLAFGGIAGLPSDLPLPLGVLLILSGCALLFRRLHDRPIDPDDGAVL